MIYSFSHQIQSNDKMEFEILVRAAQQQSPSGFLASSPICFTKVTALHPHFARARSRLAREACRWEVGMPAGTKRGYALILTSTTFVAFGAALFICWAAGAFDAPLGEAAWVAIAVLLGLGWIVGGMLVSFVFLGARWERTEARAARRAAALGRRRGPAAGNRP
jgi:hypothetical protein